MRRCAVAAGLLLLPSIVIQAADEKADAGKKATEQACQLCHGLRLIESQRLSPAAWQKEVDKMVGWGAVVPDRQLLIDYLSHEYSHTMPPAVPAISANSK